MDQDQAPRWGAIPEEEGALSERPDAKPKASFLHRWMGREAFVADNEEEDDDTEETSKKKRFRSLFKDLFPFIARKESAPKEDSESPQRSLLAEFLLAEHPEPEVKPKPLVNTEQFSFDPEGTLRIDHSQPEVEIPALTEISPAPDLPPPVFSLPPMLEHSQPQVLSTEQFTSPIHPKQIEQIPSIPPKPETQSEQKRGFGAVTSFLSSEYMSRRRHRKLKKEIQALKKRSTSLEKDLATSAKNEILQKATVGTEVVKKPTVAIEKPPVPYSVPEVAPLIMAPIILEKVSRQSVEVKQPQKEVFIAPEVSNKQEIEQKPAEKPNEINISSTEQFLIKREKDLEKLRKRTAQNEANISEAKNDIRRDKDFDRRHEVLDEPSTKTVSPIWFTPSGNLAPASSIADVLREKQATPIKRLSTLSDNAGSTSVAPQTNLYQHSAQYGVAMGIVVAVLALIAYILV